MVGESGNRIREMRKAKFPLESGRQFAKRARLNYAHLCKIERGNISPTVGTLRRVADALEVSLFDLLDT